VVATGKKLKGDFGGEMAVDPGDEDERPGGDGGAWGCHYGSWLGDTSVMIIRSILGWYALN